MKLSHGSGAARSQPLGGYLDSLVQAFEDCRPGLPDEAIRDAGQVERWFLAIYEKERPRLVQAIAFHEMLLDGGARERLLGEVDDLVRRVLVPAYARVAQRFTARERNDFYLTADHGHVAERVGWCVAGVVVGGLVVAAPFIPLDAKEWVLPFTLAGLFFPELRRLLAHQRYERDVNHLVDKTNRQIDRTETALAADGEVEMLKRRGGLDLGAAAAEDDPPAAKTSRPTERSR